MTAPASPRQPGQAIDVGDTVSIKGQLWRMRAGTVTAIDPSGWWAEVDWTPRHGFNPGKRREAITALVRLQPQESRHAR